MLEPAWEMLDLAKNGTLEHGEMNANDDNSDSN